MWEADLWQLHDRILELYPGFTRAEFAELERNIELAQLFTDTIKEFAANTPNMTDDEVVIGIQRVLALFSSNHVWFSDGLHLMLGGPIYPLRFRLLDGGIYLVESHEDYAHVMFQRLTAVNAITIENVMTESTRLLSIENTYDAWSRLAQYLPVSLITQSITGGEGQSMFSFTDSEGNVSHIYPTAESINFSMSFIPTLPALERNIKQEYNIPLFMQRPHTGAWITFLEDYGILYLRYRSFELFTWDMIRLADIIRAFNNDDIQAVVIDARDNPGGGLPSMFPHMLDIIEEHQVPLFYFVNESSRSAATYMVAYLRRHGAVVVGQPVGSSMVFSQAVRVVRDGLAVEMHYSDLTVIVPNVYRSEATEEFATTEFTRLVTVEEWLDGHNTPFYPDILIPHTIEDWAAGRDPLLEYVKTLLRSN